MKEILLHLVIILTFQSIMKLQKSWVQLKEERDTFEAQFYAREKKVLELTKLLHEERNINVYIAPKRMRSWET